MHGQQHVVDVQATMLGEQKKEIIASEIFVKPVTKVGNFLREVAQLAELAKTYSCKSTHQIHVK